RRGPGAGVSARIVPDGDEGRAAAVETLRAGGIVALPTDTVYGIAVALETPGGIERLFRAKDRPPDRGIMLLMDGAAQAAAVGGMGPAAAALAAAFSPGGLTVVVPQRPDVPLPAVLTGGAATIGLRVPDHAAPRALAAAVGPLPTTSAQRLRAPRGARRDRDPGPARRSGRPDPRWRARARWARLDRGRLQWGAPRHPARGGDPHITGRKGPRRRRCQP
ncbi:MAG TPA: Sua5/YciO/YrdC/YwlC family protein, partial [Candidatus Limnocylindrales bacterium]